MAELLVKLVLKDGSVFEFFRDADKTVRVCHDDHCLALPKATGITTTQLFALLEPLGETVIEEDDDE